MCGKLYKKFSVVQFDSHLESSFVLEARFAVKSSDGTRCLLLLENKLSLYDDDKGMPLWEVGICWILIFPVYVHKL